MTQNPLDKHLVRMRLSDLSVLPPVELPTGYSIRASQPGEAAAWCEVVAASFPEEPAPTPDKWEQQILNKHGYAPENVFFIIAPDGKPCATASAMRSHDTGEDGSKDEGYIHWVAVDPAHGGKKLGLLASLQCLHRFRERGCETTILDTHPFRLPAIILYERLGFVPLYTTPEHPACWQLIAERLGRQLPPAINEITP